MHRFLPTAFLIAALSACGSAPKPSAQFPTESWQSAIPQDDSYLLAAGDTVEVVVHSAPELSRQLKIAPDGRLRMPLADPIVASARTPDEVALALRAALASELKDPDLDVVPVDFASQAIFVGGEVRNPGMQTLPGQIDPLQAVIMAGGFTRDAKTRDVILMRRLPGGEVRTVVLDLKNGIKDPELATWLPLRRFDVVYVPRTQISEQNQFVEQFIRNALPVQFSLYYDLRQRN
ncbi:MAG: polysaccharide biosynthesis/export family protein [Hyphomonas sp.]|uniref:polysaccharide biosynthesis/export family protein n=1 Tax=Hyphomonas sp. TaxID=87 RepID=UPI0035295E4D